MTARSKPVVVVGPLGAAAATLPAPGFAKPPLACADAAAGGDEPGAEAEPGLVKPPLDGEPGEAANGTRPHSEPLLWLDENRAWELGANPTPASNRAAAAIRQRSPSLTMIPFTPDDRAAALAYRSGGDGFLVAF